MGIASLNPSYELVPVALQLGFVWLARRWTGRA